MNEPRRASHRSPSAPPFRPAFTLLMLYLFAFFVFFAVLLALPDLLEGMRSVPPATSAAAERAAGAEIARRAVHGRLAYALVAAIAATGAGAYARVLPGLRGPR